MNTGVAIVGMRDSKRTPIIASLFLQPFLVAAPPPDEVQSWDTGVRQTSTTVENARELNSCSSIYERPNTLPGARHVAKTAGGT